MEYGLGSRRFGACLSVCRAETKGAVRSAILPLPFLIFAYTNSCVADEASKARGK